MKCTISSIILFFLASLSFAQSLQRQTISPLGSSTLDNPLLFRQTVGQPYNTSANYGENVSYKPGFQQPVFRLNKISSSFSFNVFPNPASFFITISSKTPLFDITIRMFDGIGNIVYENKIIELLNFTIDCSKWSSGNYLLTINNSTESYTAKLILIH